MPDALALRTGFPWWLPLATAAIAAFIAVLVSQSTVAAWDADVHLWARDSRPAPEYTALLFEPDVQASATNGLMATEAGLPQLQDVSVQYNDALIRVTVRSAAKSDAETLALSLAHAAVDESVARFGADAGLDLLGLVRPGARQVAPTTERSAAWASAIGLLGGLAIAWLVAARSQPAVAPASALGRLGRAGYRPLAVITANSEALPSADSVLADALQPLSGVVALVPLDHSSLALTPLTQTAQRLAAQGKSVLWLDARSPAFELRYDAPPTWLLGADWSPLERSDLIQRRARQAAVAAGADGCVLLLADPMLDGTRPRSIIQPPILGLGACTVLLVRADASEAELVDARRQLAGTSLLGAVLTHASETDMIDFEIARTAD